MKLFSKLYNTSNRGEIALCVLVSLIWIQNPILSFVRGYCLSLPVIGQYADYVSPFLMLFPFLYALPFIMKKIRGFDVLFVVGFAAAFAMTYLFFPQNTPFLNTNAFNFLCILLPCYLVGRTFDIEKVFKVFYLLSVLSIVLQFYYAFSYKVSESTMGDQMVAAYSVLPHVLLIYIKMMKQFKVWDILFLLLGVFEILSFGTRGPLLCLCIFIVLFHVDFQNIRGTKTWLFIGALGAFAVFYESILKKLMSVLESIPGASIRIFMKLQEAEFMADAHRNQIRDALYRALDDHPFGMGLFGDRAVLGEDSYAHNLFVEILVDYGYILGAAFSVLLVFFTFKAYYKSREMNHYFMELLICSAMINLLLSGSYLTSIHFFLMLGFVSQINHNIKRKQSL